MSKFADNPYVADFEGPDKRRLGLTPRTIFILSALTVAAAVIGCAFYVSTLIRPSFVFSVEADFEMLPAEDQALTEWIGRQPGVVPSSVLVSRQKGSTIVVVFIMSRNLWGYPRFPDLQGACEQLGYRGRKSAFRDRLEDVE